MCVHGVTCLHGVVYFACLQLLTSLVRALCLCLLQGGRRCESQGEHCQYCQGAHQGWQGERGASLILRLIFLTALPSCLPRSAAGRACLPCPGLSMSLSRHSLLATFPIMLCHSNPHTLPCRALLSALASFASPSMPHRPHSAGCCRPCLTPFRPRPALRLPLTPAPLTCVLHCRAPSTWLTTCCCPPPPTSPSSPSRAPQGRAHAMRGQEWAYAWAAAACTIPALAKMWHM